MHTGIVDRCAAGKRYIFLLSHMRAFTSLLGHIFGSHPRIGGYTETHQSYLRPGDLARLRELVVNTTRGKPAGGVWFDKVLHNEYPLSEAILLQDGVQCLISVRAPQASARSYLKMRQGMGFPINDEEGRRFADYYRERLAQLEVYARVLGTRGLFMRAETLLEATAPTLSALSQWFDLEPELSDRYQQFAWTGCVGHGDPGPLIRSGRVQLQRNEHPEIVLSDDYLAPLQQAYEQCLGTCVAHCESLRS